VKTKLHESADVRRSSIANLQTFWSKASFLNFKFKKKLNISDKGRYATSMPISKLQYNMRYIAKKR